MSLTSACRISSAASTGFRRSPLGPVSVSTGGSSGTSCCRARMRGSSLHDRRVSRQLFAVTPRLVAEVPDGRRVQPRSSDCPSRFRFWVLDRSSCCRGACARAGRFDPVVFGPGIRGLASTPWPAASLPVGPLALPTPRPGLRAIGGSGSTSRRILGFSVSACHVNFPGFEHRLVGRLGTRFAWRSELSMIRAGRTACPSFASSIERSGTVAAAGRCPPGARVGLPRA